MFKKVGLGFGLRFGLGVALSAMLLAGCNFSSNNSSSPDKEIPCDGYLIKSQGSALQVDGTQQIDSTHLYIKTATVVADSLGNQSITLHLSAPLDTYTYIEISNYSHGLLGENQPAFVIIRTEEDLYGSNTINTFGYYITDISDPNDLGTDGATYKVKGELKDLQGNVIDGGVLGSDRIALNFEYNYDYAHDEDLSLAYNALQVDLWDNLIKWNAMNSLNFGSVYGAKVESYPESLNDWTIVYFFTPSLGGICLD